MRPWRFLRQPSKAPASARGTRSRCRGGANLRREFRGEPAGRLESLERLMVDTGRGFISRAPGCLGRLQRDQLEVVAAGQADRQCLRGAIQRALPTGVAGLLLVRKPYRGARGGRSLPVGVQRRAAQPGVGSADTGRSPGRLGVLGAGGGRTHAVDQSGGRFKLAGGTLQYECRGLPRCLALLRRWR